MKKRELKAQIAELEQRIAELERALEIANQYAEMMRGYMPYQPYIVPRIEPGINPWPGPERTAPNWEPYGRYIITCGATQ